MPNIKSQKDRVRLTEKQTARNKSARSALRTTLKKANTSIASGNGNDEAVKNASIALAKAGGKGLVHKKNAARSISRLAKRANKASA